MNSTDLVTPAPSLRQRGFTLIELMIVVAIVGIIAAIALPSYSLIVEKSRRSSAQSTLLQMFARQENYFANVKAYASNATTLGYPTNPVYLDADGTAQNASDSNTVYSVAINLTSNFEYTITATAAGRQSSDTDCATFTINQLGTKTASGTDCW